VVPDCAATRDRSDPLAAARRRGRGWISAVRCVLRTGEITERQALLYQEWIANRRRLLAIVAEMEEVSRQAVEILLAQAEREPVPSSDGPGRPGRPARRVTRPLAEALTQLAELVEPAAEAAQEWLESKENEDREAITEARDQLLASLDQSADLVTTITRLARLLASTPSRP
jgi:hypothetical protein